MCPAKVPPLPILSEIEKKQAIALIQAGKPLPLSLLEKMATLPEAGLFLWQGKYTAPPLHVTGSLEQALASAQRPFGGLLFSGDNLPLLSLLYAVKEEAGTGAKALFGPGGGFTLLYADPPFATGSVFTVPQGQAGDQSIPAFSDSWEGGMTGYYAMLWPRIQRMRALLAEDGVLCIHCDWRSAPAIRCMLDECFGPGRFVNEVVWHYTGGGRSKRYFSRKHDLLLLYSLTNRWKFNLDAVRVPYLPTSGYARSGITSKAGKQYLPNPKGTPRDDVFSIPMLNPMAKERVAYATQKPLALLEPILEAFTAPGDLVGDFFCGSGTTLEAAARLGRRFVGCDMGEQAIRTCRQRLEGFLQPKPLDVDAPDLTATAYYTSE